MTAANTNPDPMANATHLNPGTKMLARMLSATMEPATRRTWRSQVPALGTALDRESVGLPGVHAAVEDVHVGQPGVVQGLLGLRGALTGPADQNDVVIEVGADLVAVLTQQVQGHVVGPGDVDGLELPRRADVENARRVRRVQQATQVGGVEDGRCTHSCNPIVSRYPVGYV